MTREMLDWLESFLGHDSKIERVSVERFVKRRKYQTLESSTFDNYMFAAGYCLGVMHKDFRDGIDQRVMYRVKIRWRDRNGLGVRSKHFEFGKEAMQYETLERREMYDIVKVIDPAWPEGMDMVGAFNKNGDYIGDVKIAERLCDKMGIAPEMSGEADVCTIGFCAREDKWYGWSHRAIAGFGIGDKLYDERFSDDSAKPQDHGWTAIENLDDARLAAIRYADCVG
jgi:hypothetical protein